MPFVKVIVVAPVIAVNIAEAPQFGEAVAGDELLTVIFGGRRSVIEKLVRPVSLGAVMLIRNLEFSPGRMVSGLKLLLLVTLVWNCNTRTLVVAGTILVTF